MGISSAENAGITAADRIITAAAAVTMIFFIHFPFRKGSALDFRQEAGTDITRPLAIAGTDIIRPLDQQIITPSSDSTSSPRI